MNTPIPIADLDSLLGLGEDLPFSPEWSAASDFLALIVAHVLEAKPATILECGSGLSTLMLARCCALNGQGEVISLENGAEFALNTRMQLERHRLNTHARVIDAPLTPYTIADHEYSWYSLDILPQQGIDMLVIDGPPGFLQRHSRYPALPLLIDLMKDSCAIFLDDAGRQDEREIVAMWQQSFPAFRHEFVETERGCSLLRRGS